MTLAEIKGKIKSKISLVDFVKSQGVDLKQKGRSFVACCPFHQEKTPSFNVNPGGYYKCFGCGKGGDHFSFLMEMKRLSFKESLDILSKLAGVVLPSSFERDFKDPFLEDKKTLESLNMRLVNTFSHFFSSPKTLQASHYLESRGFDLSSIKDFNLGFLPRDSYWLSQFLSEKGFSLNLLQKSGIFSFNGRNCFMNERLIFPIKDLQGSIVGFGGRALEEGKEPKYINSRDDLLFKKKNILYGFYQASQSIRQEKIAMVCEGYLDVLAWHISGVKIAVAPLGTSFTYEQATLLKRFSNKVIFSFDRDKAGVEATLKSFLMVESLGLESDTIVLPEGKDPADILENEGKESLASYYQNSLKDTFDYILEVRSSFYEERNLGTQAFLEELFRIVDNNSSQIARDKKLKKISDYLSISLLSLQEDFRLWLEKGTLEKRSQQEITLRYQVGFLPSHERLLLKGLLNHPHYFPEVRYFLIDEDFQEDTMRVLYTMMEKRWGKNKSDFSLDSLFEDLEEDSQLKSFFLNSLVAEETPVSDLDLFQTTFTIYGGILQDKRRRLLSEAKTLQEQGNIDKVLPLMGTLQFLNQKIEQLNRQAESVISDKEKQKAELKSRREDV